MFDEALAHAVRAHQAGRLPQAEAGYRRALALVPGFAAAEGNLGALLRGMGRLGEAVAHGRRALRLDPGMAGVWANLGRALHERGAPGEAAAAFRAAVALAPEQADFESMHGNALHAAGAAEAALAVARRAVRLGPDHAGAFCNLGNTFRSRGPVLAALDAYRRSLALHPAQADAMANLATGLREQGRAGEAAAWYRRALALAPSLAEAQVGLGNALQDLGDLDGARGAYEAALAARPGCVEAHHNLLLSLMYHSDLSAAALLAEHRRFDALHARPLAALPDGGAGRPYDNPRDPERRLTVGYVSGDFRQHVAASFFEPLLRAHDRERVRIHCYSETVRADAVTDRLRAMTDLWRSTVGLGHAAVAEMIRADGVDILVDLAGHSAHNRLLAFAYAPAPVQVTWLGYPGTTGLSAIGHRLVDAVTDPPGSADALASETLIRLPRGFLCYRPPDAAPEVAEPPCRTQGRITFGSFNNLNKITPRVVDLWARVLDRVPGSRLLLKSRQLADPTLRGAFLARFAACGIVPGRVALAPWTTTMAEHLGAYGAVDVALDPFPYNGTTTTCEALWMGVPVVTLAGDRHAARVGASLLARLGLDELVAASPAAYVDTAAALAADRPRLAALRAGLRARLRASPLADAPGFAHQVEDAYRALWHAWCQTYSAKGWEGMVS